MMIDEWVRAFCYFLIFPAFLYFGLISWNRRQLGVALTYFTLSGFFLLLFVGLVLGHYREPIPALLMVNTGVVVALTLAVTYRATAIMLAALTSSISVASVLEELDHDEFHKCTGGSS